MKVYGGLGRNFEITMEILINFDKIYEKAIKLFERKKVVSYFVNKCYKLDLFFKEEEKKLKNKLEQEEKRKQEEVEKMTKVINLTNYNKHRIKISSQKNYANNKDIIVTDSKLHKDYHQHSAK